MPENGTRSTYSQCPIEIIMCDSHGIISSGSAFLYEHDNDTFLVTNWHNVSGRNFLNKQPLDVNGRFPVFLEAKVATFVNKQKGIYKKTSRRIQLFGSGNPLWYECPDFGSDCDVVAIPFDKDTTIPEFMHFPANKIDANKIPVVPGNTVFIIGYPMSLSVGYGLPIWKSGYIASEPFYPVTIDGKIAFEGGVSGGKNLPAFFLDSLTRQGMSGSPVFSEYTGIWSLSDPYEEVDLDHPDFWSRADVALNATAKQFIGVYSGRIKDNEEGAALGLCWGEDVIRKICTSKNIGKDPHILIK